MFIYWYILKGLQVKDEKEVRNIENKVYINLENVYYHNTMMKKHES